MRHLPWLLFALIASGSGWAGEPASASGAAVGFNRDIRPILSEHCFPCHGPDKEKRKAKLRLDTREGLFADRDGHAMVSPGKPADSEVIRRIESKDPDDLMPPPNAGKPLTPHQVGLLRRWVQQGAAWQGHWAYVPPQRPPLPTVRRKSWPLTPVDHFILARLEHEGLEPSPLADRRTLLRRASFDLTGLPPRAADVEAFASDRSPDAYERWVDRLLASPHYGERMAMVWLDVVRYADTDGFHADNYRSVWPYRDYVIGAFNRNLPFDQFTREQLGGDLLPNATLEQRVASTFNRLGRSTEEGGAQPKEYLAKYAAERVRAVGTVWLGSTTGCAECHDHKYDPYSLRDFYRLAAYFADIQEQGVGVRTGSVVPSLDQARELDRLNQRLAELDQRLHTVTPELAQAQAAWERSIAASLADGTLGWKAIRPAAAESKGGATLTVLDDLSVLASGIDPPNDTYEVVLPAPQRPVTGIRLEVLTHPSMAKGSLARGNGNFVLTGFEVETRSTPAAEPRPIVLAQAIADYSQPDHPVTNAIDDKPDTGWAVGGHEKAVDHQAAFIFTDPLDAGPAATLTIRMRHDSGYKQHNVGRFRFSLIAQEGPTLDPTGLPEAVMAALRVASSERIPVQREAIQNHFLATTSRLAPTRAQHADVRRQQEQLTARVPTTLMTVAGVPRETRVLPRGNWMDDSGDVVLPGPPEFLSQGAAPDRRQTRLDLANWLVARENPLTARVLVNRIWAMFFGVGLSKRLDDFGAQGEWPVHPELLDWLAVEFVDSGWDVKHLVRLLVLSNTYRQDSVTHERQRERDPGNRLYARQVRFRISAEMVRDNALAVSGLLVDRVGGPSVKPYQPAGYWDQLNFPKRTWEADHGDSLYRRGLYTFWCRTFLHPSLLNFDACPREEATAARNQSNTPLQALTLLNDPIYVEAARAFAERMLRQPVDRPRSRIAWAFREVLGRPPKSEETRLLEQLYLHEQGRFADQPDAASQLIHVGERPAPADLPAVELAAWTATARALLNLHETIVRP